jgi:hypothetical protein
MRCYHRVSDSTGLHTKEEVLEKRKEKNAYLKKIPHGHPPENWMVIYPHVVSVDGSVSTEEAGV